MSAEFRPSQVTPDAAGVSGSPDARPVDRSVPSGLDASKGVPGLGATTPIPPDLDSLSAPSGSIGTPDSTLSEDRPTAGILPTDHPSRPGQTPHSQARIETGVPGSLTPSPSLSRDLRPRASATQRTANKPDVPEVGVIEAELLDEITEESDDERRQREEDERLIASVPRQPGGRIRWQEMEDDPEKLQSVIEAFAREANTRAVRVSQAGLKEGNYGFLWNSIRKYYPGGIEALRERIDAPIDLVRARTAYIDEHGLPRTKKGDVCWSVLAREGRVEAVIEAMSRRAIKEGMHISYSQLREKRMKSLVNGISGYYPGGITALRRSLILSEGKPGDRRERVDLSLVFRDKIGRISWSKMKQVNPKIVEATVEEQARAFLDRHGGLSYKKLERNGQSGLGAAIRKYYPGKVTGLKRRLGVDVPESGRIWTVDRIVEEVSVIYDQEGDFSKGMLERIKRWDLRNAIQKHYPGGYSRLKVDMGLSSEREMRKRNERQKPKGYWTIERIEGEIESFYEGKDGELRYYLFMEHGRLDLYRAIRRNYPGGLQGLRETLGLRPREVILREEIGTFVRDAAKGETLEAHEFRKLVGLFGGSHAADILYRLRPEFRGLPIDYVNGVIGAYLGNYLLSRGPLDLEGIEVGLPYLSEPSFSETLYEAAKEKALLFFHQRRMARSTQTSLETIEEYLADVRAQVAELESQELDEVLQRVREFYRTAFEGIVRPAQIVDALKEGRRFPDENQRVNMQEIADKKRMLIGDDMGLGKSASAILTKEWLGLGCALVVVPSNVISTWECYLSDDRELGGYFKEGHAPRVIRVRSVEALRDVDASSYDYVLVSQERLNGSYMPHLERIDYDMLIVDEVHKLKNLKEGKRAANLIELAARVEVDDRYLVLLSGTPVPNKIEDIAMILKLLYPKRFENIDDDTLVYSIIHGELIDIRSLLVPHMQMKELAESIDMPAFTEEVVEVELTPEEQDIYAAILEEDELTASEKIAAMRKFLLNPALLGVAPSMEGSKVKAVGAHMRGIFEERDKVVMFVNGYIEGVIRGEDSIIDSLDLPVDVEVRAIHGRNRSARDKIQREFQTGRGKMLLLVSGQTADVGVDFSAAEAVVHFNEPWSEYEKRQQLGRVYREGLEHPLDSYTFVAPDTIEEGIHYYIGIKYRAIQKLLRGIPQTQMERELLEQAEKQEEPNLEVSPELARYYFTAWRRMMRMFAHVKQIGERDFIRFLSRHGGEYADTYSDLGARSYHANANRVSATVVDVCARECTQDVGTARILDLASGPAMLQRHMPDGYEAHQFTNLDINRHHFTNGGGNGIVGSFSRLPLGSRSYNLVNLTLSLHYTRFAPSKGDVERAEVFAEMNRVLEPGGHAVVNLINSFDIKDLECLDAVADALGFKVVGECSGVAQAGTYYQSRIVTLEKVRDLDDSAKDLVKLIDKEDFDGLKFRKVRSSLRDSRRIITEFDLNGQTMSITFNEQDGEVMREEQEILAQGDSLISQYGTIDAIPEQALISNNFVRIFIGSRYILFKKLQTDRGVVIIRQ